MGKIKTLNKVSDKMRILSALKVAVVVVAALALWYFLFSDSGDPVQPTSTSPGASDSPFSPTSAAPGSPVPNEDGTITLTQDQLNEVKDGYKWLFAGLAVFVLFLLRHDIEDVGMLLYSFVNRPSEEEKQREADDILNTPVQSEFLEEFIQEIGRVYKKIPFFILSKKEKPEFKKGMTLQQVFDKMDAATKKAASGYVAKAGMKTGKRFFRKLRNLEKHIQVEQGTDKELNSETAYLYAKDVMTDVKDLMVDIEKRHRRKMTKMAKMKTQPNPIEEV